MKPTTREWVKKAENDFKVACQILRRRKDIVPCFHCQQCVEKYLKARLLEAGIGFPRPHDLLQLLNACLPVEPLWSAYSKVADGMTDYAVDFRYPGHTATLREAKMALKHCCSLRAEAIPGAYEIVNQKPKMARGCTFELAIRPNSGCLPA